MQDSVDFALVHFCADALLRRCAIAIVCNYTCAPSALLRRCVVVRLRLRRPLLRRCAVDAVVRLHFPPVRCCAAAPLCRCALLSCICPGALLRRRAVGRLDSRRCAATFPTYQTYLTYKTCLTYLTYKNLSNRSKLPNLIYVSSSILFICYPHLSYFFYLI